MSDMGLVFDRPVHYVPSPDRHQTTISQCDVGRNGLGCLHECDGIGIARQFVKIWAMETAECLKMLKRIFLLKYFRIQG